MCSGARRALLVGTVLPAVTAVTLLATAAPAGAHEVDAGSLPAPPWLLGYLGAFAVLATALAVRGRATPAGRSPLPPDEAVDGGGRPPEPRVTVGSLVALALLGGVLVAALAGENLQAANVAPVAVSVIWWVGLPLLCLVVGNVLRVANPFVPLVALLERVLPARPGAAAAAAPAWTAGALLLAFRWFYLAYYRPGSPRAVATLLVAYTAVAVAGGWWWGRRWLLTGEGFGALSSALAGLGRRRTIVPGPVLLAVAVAWLGATAFDAVTATGFWDDVLGTDRGWARTGLGTAGLAWVTGIVAAAALAVARLAPPRPRPAEPVEGSPPEEARPRSPGWLLGVVGLALLAVAAGWFVAHDLTLLLFEGQNFLILLSDPLGRGWDLFGTLDHDVDLDLVQAGWVRVVQLGALLGGHVAAVVLTHHEASGRLGRRQAMRLTWAVSALAAVSIAAAALLVLE